MSTIEPDAFYLARGWTARPEPPQVVANQGSEDDQSQPVKLPKGIKPNKIVEVRLAGGVGSEFKMAGELTAAEVERVVNWEAFNFSQSKADGSNAGG